jgi:TadE-like protein
MLSQRGQATVELVALLPLVVLAAAVLLQVALAGHAAWSAAQAARAGARAVAVGGDPRAAARAALPASLARGLRVVRGRDGEVRVTVRVPSPSGLDMGTVEQRARLGGGA